MNIVVTSAPLTSPNRNSHSPRRWGAHSTWTRVTATSGAKSGKLRSIAKPIPVETSAEEPTWTRVRPDSLRKSLRIAIHSDCEDLSR